MVLRSVLVAVAAVAVTGCASQEKPATALAPTPTFQRPQDIRPSDSAFKVAPRPEIAAKPAAPAKIASGPWAPPSSVKARPWKYIVLHHSASPAGNAVVFDREHRQDNGWDELGYHFVIDNGRGGADGRVEIGPRWTKQKWGAHAKTPDNRYNDFGIGICFVGNFEQTKPTAKQLESASKLIAFLMETYNIPEKNVIGHEDTGKQTLCPGKNLNVARIRGLAEQVIAQDSGRPSPLAEADPQEAEQTVIAHIAAAPEDRELLQSR